MKITDEMREAVRTALAWPSPDAIIAAVAPLILEEAAKVALAYERNEPIELADRDWNDACKTIADAIRALTPPSHTSNEEIVIEERP